MSNTHVNVDIGTTEVVDALVHQRIASMEAEIKRLQDAERAARIEADNADERISETVVLRPDMDSKFSFFWDHHCNVHVEPNSDDWTSGDINISGQSRDSATRKSSGTLHLFIFIDPSAPDIADDVKKSIAARAEERGHRRRRSQIATQLRDPRLREKLRGDMLTALIRDRAPEIAKAVDNIVNRPLLTVDVEAE